MTEAPELVIEFDRLRAEGPLGHRHELLNIQADLRIAVGGREWLSQPRFPAVELAAAADRWLSRGGDFVFEAMEAEESPSLWVRAGAGGWLAGARWQGCRVWRAAAGSARGRRSSRWRDGWRRWRRATLASPPPPSRSATRPASRRA